MLLPPPLVPVTPCTNAPFTGYLKPSIRSFRRFSHAPAARPCSLLVEVSGKCLAGIFLAQGKVSCAEGCPRALVLPARQVSLRASTGHCKATALGSLKGLGKLVLPVDALVPLQKHCGANPLAGKGCFPYGLQRADAAFSLVPAALHHSRLHPAPAVPRERGPSVPPREKPCPEHLMLLRAPADVLRLAMGQRGAGNAGAPWPHILGPPSLG